MKRRIWAILVALLSLLSLDSALRTKEAQFLGKEFLAFDEPGDAPDPHANPDGAQDYLSQRVQKILDRTAYQKRIFQLIRHGSVKVRIQVPSTDSDTMFCVTRVASPINHLAIAKCQYTADQFFTYNVDAGTLQSYGAEDEGFWVPAQTIPTELQDQFKGKIPFVLSETQPESPQKWNVRVPSTDKISFVTDDPFVNFCMQTSINGWSMKLFAKKLRSLWGACSAMHVVTPEDDEMAGRIVQFRWDSSTRSVVQECVTFDETTVLPDSALVLRACVAGATNQQFTYNIITKHLRTAVNNAVLFFWWRGPIKALEDLSDEEEGYGWTIPLRRPGSVVAVDHRGYSGVCWASRSGRIIAAQSCGTFAMLPTTETYLYRVLSQAHSYQSVYVMTQNSAQNVTECLTIRRIPQTERGKLLDEKVLWDFLFSACNFDRLEQRFILVSPIQNPCTNRSCYGTLRWAGDYNIMVVPFYADPYDMVSDARLVGGSMSEYEYTFHFPYQRFDRIRVTRKAQKYQNHTACVGRRRYISLLSGNFTRCPLFTVVPTSQLPPDSLDQVTIIARYDYRWMVALPNDRSIKQNNRARLDLKRELSQDFTDNFGRNFDYFIGDLGVRGIRRFRALGSGLHPQPSGEIRANTKADTPNGISLPLLFQDVHNHPYISIDLYLRVNRAQIQRRTHNSFLLMSFARSSGCVVYVTYTGKPGIRCYLSSAVFASDQVLTWPQDLFDGQFHKVSVVFSANTRSGVVQLYIDGQLISDLTRNKRWSLFNTGENVAFFYDPHFWEFAPLPGSLLRASVVGSDNLTRIQEIATRQVLSYQPFQGDVESIEKVPELKTVWSDCALIRGSGVHYEGLECSITAQQDGETVTVPQDVFSLGCSRPGCTITFLPHQPKLADRYRFIYKPHYPKGFVSENVGDPALFHDPAKLTDGFQTRTASFGLKFSPTATVDDTQEGAAQDPTAGENMLELANGDFMSYVCVQSCCGQVSGLAVQDQEAIF